MDEGCYPRFHVGGSSCSLWSPRLPSFCLTTHKDTPFSGKEEDENRGSKSLTRKSSYVKILKTKLGNVFTRFRVVG